MVPRSSMTEEISKKSHSVVEFSSSIIPSSWTIVNLLFSPQWLSSFINGVFSLFSSISLPFSSVISSLSMFSRRSLWSSEPFLTSIVVSSIFAPSSELLTEVPDSSPCCKTSCQTFVSFSMFLNCSVTIVKSTCLIQDASYIHQRTKGLVIEFGRWIVLRVVGLISQIPVLKLVVSNKMRGPVTYFFQTYRSK